ncbi:MAG: RNA polymerase sigma factor [Planctomycetota bacterium]
MDESEELRAVRRGDASAFEALYTRHRIAVYRYACTLTRQRSDADDLFQDAFLGFLRNVQEIRSADRVLPYLLRSIRNRHIDSRRRAANKNESLTAAEVRAAGSAPWQHSEEVEGLKQIALALQQLPEEQAETVRLRIYGELSYDDIAIEHAVPAATVRTRFRLALDKLRHLLGRSVRDV